MKQMKLPIPFFPQTTPLNCGPAALKMVLTYFDANPEIEIIEEKTGIKEGKGVSTIQIGTATALLGFKAAFYSKHVYFNKENLKLEFYQKYLDIAAHAEKLVSDAKKAGVIVEEKTISQKELLDFVTEKSIPIILLDWNIIKGVPEKGYQGHFVPIVGYDEENVFVHNHGLNQPKEFMPISRDVFEKARKAQGTDEDVVIIYRKENL